MHRSGPVREIAAAELAGVDTRPFGLEDAALVVTVFADGPRPVLTARFGVLNPEGFLQYMRLDGDARVLLLSRLVAGALLHDPARAPGRITPPRRDLQSVD